jgi:hypothetical protein
MGRVPKGSVVSPKGTGTCAMRKTLSYLLFSPVADNSFGPAVVFPRTGSKTGRQNAVRNVLTKGRRASSSSQIGFRSGSVEGRRFKLESLQ